MIVHSEQLAAAKREIEQATAEPRARAERLTRQIAVLGQQLSKQAHVELMPGGAR